jgi:hypothetical protein
MPDSNDDSRPQKEDSKDFVEQLRLIHFTLIVTCLGLVVIALSPPPKLMERAREQLGQIVTVSSQWGPGKEFMSSAQKHSANNKLYPQWRIPDKQDTLQCPPDSLQPATWKSPHTERNYILGERPIQALFHGGPFLNTHNQPGFRIKVPPDMVTETIEPPKNILEFRRLWDARLDLVCATEINNRVFTLNPTVAKELKRSMGNKTGDQINFALAENSTIPGIPPEVDADGVSFTDRNDFSPHIVLPVKTVSIPVDIRAEIRGKFTQGQWFDGDFAYAFYELDKATSGIQKLPFSDLAPVLDQQEQREKGTFEAFGIKFPAEGTVRWGILLILGVQLYFWLHVAEYRRRAFPRTDVAWIGAYPQLVSRIVFFLTSAVAPVLVVAFLLFFQREQAVTRVWADLAFLLSGIMAAILWHEHRRSNLSATNPVPTTTSMEARSATQGKG